MWDLILYICGLLLFSISGLSSYNGYVATRNIRIKESRDCLALCIVNVIFLLEVTLYIVLSSHDKQLATIFVIFT